MSTTYHLDRGSGYGGVPYSVGQVLRNSDRRIAQGEPEYLFVEKAGQRYYREEGMSFGVGDESGYAYWATARPATDEESRPLREAREQKVRALALQARKGELVEQIKRAGARPPGPVSPEQEPGAYRIFDTQNIHGGGDWIVISDSSVWFCRNNGHDGDAWSHNNVRTGGAGAIGWRVAHDQGLVSELLEIEAALQPDAAARRRPDGASRAYAALFAQHVDPALWPPPIPLESCSRGYAWVSAGADTPALIGYASDGTLRLAVPAHVPYPSPYGEAKGFSTAYMGCDYALLAYEASPARIAAYEAQLPAWATLDVVRSCTSRAPEAPGGAEGCFILPLQGSWRPVAATAREAIRGCGECLLADVKYRPNATLLYVHKSDDNPWTLWRVQEAAGSRLGAVRGHCLSSLAEPLHVVSPAASDLIAVGLRQQYWREGSRWQQFLDVATVEERSIDRYERHRSYSGDEVHLDEIQARTTGRQEYGLFRVREHGWAMGEDGDEWKEERLFADRTAAVADYQACKARILAGERGPGLDGFAPPPGPSLER